MWRYRIRGVIGLDFSFLKSLALPCVEYFEEEQQWKWKNHCDVPERADGSLGQGDGSGDQENADTQDLLVGS